MHGIGNGPYAALGVEEETGLGRRDSWILNNKDVEELGLDSGKGRRGQVSGEQGESNSLTSSVPPLGKSCSRQMEELVRALCSHSVLFPS